MRERHGEAAEGQSEGKAGSTLRCRQVGAPLECLIQHCGHEHATPCRRNGQRGRARVAEFAQDKRPLEFQGDKENKQRHQAVVDPFPQRTGKIQ